jgi:adenylate cyclase, class 2
MPVNRWHWHRRAAAVYFFRSLYACVIFPRCAGWYRLRPMQAMETEVKIRVADREALEQKLPALGFTRVTARTLERNTLYDKPDRELRNSRQILRIRQYGSKWAVTHKSVPSGLSEEGPHKNRVETETAVEEGPVLGKIFEALGFHPVFVYEKWRTEWADRQGHCVLDETPLGLYAELEGPGEWIDATARKLGIRESDFITLSYGRIFEVWRDQTGSKATNFTFEEIPESFRT